MSKFQTKDEHWWSMQDRQAVVDTVRRLKGDRESFRVLEFGPGWSTRALIEGGATFVDACEDNPVWAQTHEERLGRDFPDAVKVHRYTWHDDLSIPGVGNDYDLSLIDGPLGTDRRATAARYALGRSRAVLAPIETKNPDVLAGLQALAEEAGAEIEVWESGPLSGGFALITRKPVELSDFPVAPQVKSSPAVPIIYGVLSDEAPISETAPKLSKRQQKKLAKAAKDGKA